MKHLKIYEEIGNNEFYNKVKEITILIEKLYFINISGFKNCDNIHQGGKYYTIYTYFNWITKDTSNKLDELIEDLKFQKWSISSSSYSFAVFPYDKYNRGVDEILEILRKKVEVEKYNL